MGRDPFPQLFRFGVADGSVGDDAFREAKELRDVAIGATFAAVVMFGLAGLVKRHR